MQVVSPIICTLYSRGQIDKEGHSGYCFDTESSSGEDKLIKRKLRMILIQQTLVERTGYHSGEDDYGH